MIAIAGIAFEVPTESVEEAERMVKAFLGLQCSKPMEGEPIPLKVWVAADHNTETRDAAFKYKDLKARHDPEFALTDAGRAELDRRLQTVAEEAAQPEPGQQN